MTEESQNLEDNLEMVNYIMLHRIYDLLSIMAIHFEPEKAKQMIEYHTEGYLLGPTPSFTPNDEENS